MGPEGLRVRAVCYNVRMLWCIPNIKRKSKETKQHCMKSICEDCGEMVLRRGM